MINAEPLFDKAMDPYRSRTERHVRALAKARRRRTLSLPLPLSLTLTLTLTLTLNLTPTPTLTLPLALALALTLTRCETLGVEWRQLRQGGASSGRGRASPGTGAQ